MDATNEHTGGLWVLHEHEDGRLSVCRAGEERFTDGDPGWHRNGPVTVHGAEAASAAAPIPPDQIRAIREAWYEADGLLEALRLLADADLAGRTVDGWQFSLRGSVRRLDELLDVLWSAAPEEANLGTCILNGEEIARVVWGKSAERGTAPC